MLPIAKNITVDDNEVYRFTLDNIDVSIANALRQSIIGYVNCVVFDIDTAEFYKNTGKLHNEILKQRLQCIPVVLPEALQHSTQFDANDYYVELNIENTLEDNNAYMAVTTEHFVLKRKSDDAIVKDISLFPKNSISNDYILFTKLNPQISTNISGEALHFKCGFKIGNSAENGCFNVVSACLYKQSTLPDTDKIVVTAKNEFMDKWIQSNVENYKKVLEKESGGTESAITIKLNEYKKTLINSAEYNIELGNWNLLDRKRLCKKNSYEFGVESIGVYSNQRIVYLACEDLVKELGNFIERCNEQYYEIRTNNKATIDSNGKLPESTIENTSDVILYDIDERIGYIINYMCFTYLYKDYLTYCAFKKMHPHDSHSVLRLSFKKSIDPVQIYKLLSTIIEKHAMPIITSIQDSVGK